MNITDLITDRMHENLNPRDIDTFERFRWLIEKIATEYTESEVKNLGLFSVSGCFSFAKYVNGWYEYADNTENGDVYNNVVTGRLMTEKQIFDEWLKLNNR